MSNAEMIADILAGGRVINREDKMKASMDVMCENLDKRHSSNEKVALQSESENRGYNRGHGKGTGD